MSESQCGKTNNLNALSYKYFKALCTHLRELMSRTQSTILLWCIFFVTKELTGGKREAKTKKKKKKKIITI